MRSKLLPSRNVLRCAVCDRDWSKSARTADGLEAMWTWNTGNRDVARPRVTSCRLVCQGRCDSDDSAASMNLPAYAGPEAAWNAAEELLSGYDWPAPLRRKLLAFLRDAARLPADGDVAAT
jgi:hypothetical protein